MVDPKLLDAALNAKICADHGPHECERPMTVSVSEPDAVAIIATIEPLIRKQIAQDILALDIYVEPQDDILMLRSDARSDAIDAAAAVARGESR